MNTTIALTPTYFNALPTWGHKMEAQAGDTVYLQHDSTIRGVTLTTARSADPRNGRIYIRSPIGRALTGCRQGSKVRLNTLDGQVTCRIIKIV
jgi:transcription elongation GreA/GreB family factor